MDFEQLTAAVIHDLKNQVQSVVAESDLLLQTLPDEHKAPLSSLLRRTRGIQEEISQLITLYQMKSHSIFSSEEAWPLSTLRIVAEQIQMQHPDVAIECHADDNLSGWYNDFLMQMALACLITNSIQAGACRIRLNAEQSVDGLSFTVADDGPGFPPEVLAGERVSHKVGGTGLGLYFSELVALHHKSQNKSRQTSHQKSGPSEGTLTLSNPADGGSQAVLRLP